MTTLPPVLDMQAVQEVEVPDVGPQALAYVRHPAVDPGTQVQRRWLFLAGGTLGLWRITLCEELFQTPPVACSDSSFQRTRIDRPGSDSTWKWKRCVDVAIVQGNASAGQPLLFALYAANSDPLKSTIGPTELRCYKLEPDGTTSLFAAVDLPADGPGGIDAVGTALASDPADPDNVYVALGTAWLWKVTIGAGTLSPTQVPAPAIALCSLSPCPDGEAMTDIDLVRIPSVGPVVYAALEYGRVLEYRLQSGVVKQTTLACDTPQGAKPSYLDRVAAVAGPDNAVLIVVAAQDEASRYVQTTAPFMADGLWSDICVSTGVGNANAPPGSDKDLCREIQFLWGRPASTSSPAVLSVDRVSYDRLWGSLVLTHQSGLDFRLYACSERSATSVFGILNPPPGAGTMAPPLPPADPLPALGVELLATWRGPYFAPADGAMSIVNPGLTFHGQDGFGPYDGAGELQILPMGSGVDFLPVEEATSSCPGPGDPPPPDTCGPPGSTFSVGNRSPFGGSVAGSATWRDPFDPALEWFMPGGLTSVPVQNCTELSSLCDVSDPCSADPMQRVRWRTKELLPMQNGVGWSLVRLHPNPPTGQPQTGPGLQMKWWQVSSPHESASARSDTVSYVFSAADPRLVDPDPGNPNDFPVPWFIHFLRGGSDSGYKVMDPLDLIARARMTCPTPNRRGRGENLAPDANDQPAFSEARTHVEFELPGSLPGEDPCNIIVACAGDGAGAPRQLQNNKLHVFSVRDPAGQEVWIAAVAAAFVASGPSQITPPLIDQTASCQWTADYGRALVTFYDLTTLAPGPGGGSPPHLIRVALGPAGVQSHAFAIRTKSTGTGPNAPVYAYVADLTGRLFTYDVSWNQLFIPTPPPQGSPYRPYAGAPQSHHPILEPIPNTTIVFPTSPYDGLRPNCVDVEIDGDDAYCALARAGIGIVDLSTPAAPMLYTILDTPGLTQGIVFRPDGLGDVQMVVGDSRAGMRLYGRPAGGGFAGDGDGSGGGGEGDEP